MPSAAEMDKMRHELSGLDPKAIEQLPPELRDSLRNVLPKGLPKGGAPAPSPASTSASPRLPGMPGLGGGGLPGLGGFKLPGLPGFGGGKPPEKKKPAVKTKKSNQSE